MAAMKNLALTVLVSGTLATPTLAGAMKHQPVATIRPAVDVSGPTRLTYAAAVSPVPAPPRAIGAENLASSSYASGSLDFGYGAGPASYNSGFVSSSSSNALGVTSSSYAWTSGEPLGSGSPAAASNGSSGSGGGGLPFNLTPASHAVAAYINFGNSPYSEAQSLTTGNPQAWYTSQAVQNVFHGTPNAGQQAGFIAEVLQTVQHTYALSGLNVSLTTDPNQNYAHTMSVVSGASYSANPGAIGITDVGNDGFSFIDKFGQARNPDELAIAVGKNLAHELMHAFGVANHPDQSGNFIDASTANWSLLTNPDSTLSPQAAQLLAAQNFLSGPGKEFAQGSLGITGLEILTQHHPVTCHCPKCNSLHQIESAEMLGNGNGPAPVPEPTTVALWTLAGGLTILYRRRKLA